MAPEGIESKDDNSRSVCYVCEKGFESTGWDTCPKCIALIEDAARTKTAALREERETARGLLNQCEAWLTVAVGELDDEEDEEVIFSLIESVRAFLKKEAP